MLSSLHPPARLADRRLPDTEVSHRATLAFGYFYAVNRSCGIANQDSLAKIGTVGTLPQLKSILASPRLGCDLALTRLLDDQDMLF